ncbi:hypothetical protein [Flavobacterium algicola]|uniref:hypothetical protein n=1 Tax=Flavobacterium algicola TaxID=556529 RepID=UPI001EFCCF6D|nr:hypothetical protein [Flavobacterium algicola]MCG9794190.1 hypothetical protein [Flavobacterium algicola]
MDVKFEIENQECEGFVCGFKNVEDFRIAFRQKYKYIVAFHATNLSGEEVKSIRKEGLKIASKELLERKAIHRFIVNESVEKSREIEKDIKEWFATDDVCDNKFITKNEINFFILKSDLFEHYHYLLFGSESLLPLAVYLGKKHRKSFKQILVNSGLHYIIEVLIPIIKTDDEYIDSIYYFFNKNSDVPLVYNYNLPEEYVVKIEEVDRPFDRQNLILN